MATTRLSTGMICATVNLKKMPTLNGHTGYFLLCLLLLSFSSLILSFVFLFEIGLGCDLAQRHKTRVWGSGRQRTYQLLTFND